MPRGEDHWGTILEAAIIGDLDFSQVTITSIVTMTTYFALWPLVFLICKM